MLARFLLFALVSRRPQVQRTPPPPLGCASSKMLKIWSMVWKPRARAHRNYIIQSNTQCRKKSKRMLKMPRDKRLEAKRRRSRPLNYEYRRVRAKQADMRGHRELTGRATFAGADLSELSLGSTMKTDFPDPDDILNFVLTVDPDEGMYQAARFTFDFAINQNFPHEPPKVRCREKIYHPNIDLEGKVCLNILREDWKPVLNLNAVIVGLQVRSSVQLTLPSDIQFGLCLLLPRWWLTVAPVPLPRAERVGSVEQGGSRGSTKQPRGIQEKRPNSHGRWHSQGHVVRPGIEIDGRHQTSKTDERA